MKLLRMENNFLMVTNTNTRRDTIQIKKGYQINLSIDFGCNNQKCIYHSNLDISENLYCGSAHIFLGDSNSSVKIGSDCMLSDNIQIYCSDGHSILDQKGQLINQGKQIDIGNHVWIGMDVKIGKNVKIPNHCIIGWNSVVTKEFNQDHCIIAGNPAKVVKENISWLRESPSQLLKRKHL